MLDRLETRVPPLAWMGVAILVVLAASLLGERLVPEGRGAAIGLIVMLMGAALTMSGTWRFGKAKTSVDPRDLTKTNELVVDGVYRLTRNPMYLGMLGVVVGIGLRGGSVVATLAGAGFFVAVITRLQIIPEERMLKQEFGKAYDEFMQSARRWI